MRVPGVAEAADDKKRSSNPRSLLRDLAHELRDALSPVSASIDLLRVRQFEADTARVVAERVERGLRRAFTTLESFVLAEQAEDGTLALAAVPCALADVLATTRELLDAGTRERCMLGADAQNHAVLADPGRTAQVLQSVLQHASIVALPRTQIEVRPTAGAAPRLRIGCQTDPRFGPGEDWFVAFHGPGGCLALRTARRIMELQHGTLELARQAGECTFEVSFRPASAQLDGTPAPRPAAEPEDTGVAPRVVRLLIVDDNAEVRRAYREALLPLGYAVTEAAEADQALRQLDADAPQVALIDIHLPRINGYRLAQSIKARMGSAVRLVMLSGMSLDPTMRQLSSEAGFDDCLDKMAGPLALHALLQGLRPKK